MLSRRDFARLIATALTTPLVTLRALSIQVLAQSRETLPKTSVMMWTLNKSGTFESNLERVAQAGYNQVELVSEFKNWSGPDTRRILGRMQALGITVDAMAGMTLGFADPMGGEAFVAELKTLIPTAQTLGCHQIILLSGKRVENASSPDQVASIQNPSQHSASVNTLKRAAQVLIDAGLVGVIEPIDRLENPSVYLDGVTEAFSIARAVDSPSIRVLYDLYHEQRTHGNIIEKLENNIQWVGLIHVADVPGRNEPGTGEVNFGNVYRKLAQLKYKGTIAMEFYPTGDMVATLRSAREQVLRSFDPGSSMR